MIGLGKYISATVNKVRTITAVLFGKNVSNFLVESAPFGVDAQPVQNMQAIFVETVTGKTVIIGYVNVQQLAAAGEVRLFAADSNGNPVGYTWLKNDNTYEILGSDDNMVRYSALETAYNDLKSKLNDLISKYNTHTHTGVQTGSGTSAVTAATETASTGDITPAKIARVKTIKSDSSS